jgi:hypothetical protein
MYQAFAIFPYMDTFNLISFECFIAKEVVMMSCKVQKWNKYNWQQERNFILTNQYVYNFNKKSKCCKKYVFKLIINIELRRSIKISELNGVTKNMSANSKEFVMHVSNEADYRLSCEQ